LVVWQAAVYFALRRRGTGRSIEVVFRPQHYLQAAVQVSVFLYWGYYWAPVYDHALLILAQLLFAYGFDILLAFSRRQRYVLGCGPFPIILSVNLFLWFRDDWFYLQFLMIAVGYLGKEFVHWQRDGRDAHIFNPSAFSLGLFSLALIATGTTDLTWGQSIATTLTLAPRIYTFLFLVGLLVMYRFSITLIAGSAAVVLFAWSSTYFSMTVFRRFGHTRCSVSWFAPAGDRSLDNSPLAAREDSIRRSLWGRRLRAVRATHCGGRACLL
jgi:hypothetical protein